MTRKPQCHDVPKPLLGKHYFRVRLVLDPVRHQHLKTVQYPVGVVGTKVRKNQQVVNAKGEMMREPFEDIGPLVAHHGQHERFLIPDRHADPFPKCAGPSVK